MRWTLLLCLALFLNFILVRGHDRQRLVEVATVLSGGAIVLLAYPAVWARLFAGHAGKALMAFFALGILGTATAFSPRLAAFEVANLFLLYVAGMTTAEELARYGQRGLRLILTCMAAACVLYACLFVVVYIGSLSLHIPLELADFTVGFNNFRFFNHTQTSTLPLLVLLCCLTPRTSKLRWLWLVLTTYWWMALYVTAGRGTMVGMAAGCVVAAAVARQGAGQYLRQMVLTAVLAIVAYYIFLVAIPPLFGIEGMHSFSDTLNRTAADPTSARTYLWHRATSLIVQHPWLGVGPMHFAHHAGDIHLGGHPHDWLFQVGAEWGLPGLLCLLVALGLGLRALVRTGWRVPAADTDNKNIFAALLVGAVAILVDGLVSGIFVMPQSQLGVALYLGCAFGWQRYVAPQETQAGPRRAIRVVIMTSVVAAMVAVVVAVWTDAPARWRGDEMTPAQQAANTGNLLSPRLWTAGFF